MLISDDKKFLFVHVQKTAGNSVRQALESVIPDLRNFLGTHDRAMDAKRQLGDRAYGDYFSAAFVRNPWDRLLSWYSMIVKTTVQSQSRGSRKPADPGLRLWRYVLENSNSFEDFIRNCTAEIDDHDGRKSFMWNQLDYLVDEQGRPIVDFIGKYESIEQDARQLFQRLGLEGIELPSVNQGRHRHYSTYYSDELAEVVRRRFQRDIEAFGYEFVRQID
jgi:hypothetical protein